MYYTEGLFRVTHISRTFSQYDNLFKYKFKDREDYKFMFDDNVKHKEKIKLAKKYFNKKITNFIPKSYKIPTSTIVSFAHTENNKKNIKIILNDVKKYIQKNIEIFNFAENKYKKNNNLLISNVLKEKCIEKFNLFIDKHIVNSTILFNCIQYTCAYIELYPYFCDYNIDLLIVSNDHSPYPVALSMLAKQNKIKRLYIQHGAVTKFFPPLDFEYSILWNEYSLNIYSKISSGALKNVICKNDNNPYDFNNIIRNIENCYLTLYDVIIYVSSILNIENIIKAIKNLQINSKVKNIKIKFHPATNIESKKKILSRTNVTELFEVPENHHVAIVSNSSIIFELLQKSIPTLYVYGLDFDYHDYFEVVKNNIVHEIAIDDLKNDFTNNLEITQQFFENYKQYNTNVKSFFNDINNVNYPEFLLKIFEFNIDKELFFLKKKEFIFVKELKLSPHLLCSKNFTFDLFFFNLCEKLYKERFPPLIKIISSDINNINSSFQLWLGLKHLSTSNYRDVGFLKKSIYFYIKNIKSLSINNNIANLIIYCLFKYSMFNEIKNFIPYININKLTKKNILALVSHNILPNDITEKVNIFLDIRDETLLKIMSQTSNLSYEDYKTILFSYLHKNIKKEIEYGLKKFDKIEVENNFMDIRTNYKSKNRLFSIINTAIVNKTPFSLIRLSDGEGYIFENKYFTCKDRVNRELHWWGVVLTNSIRQNILNDLAKAIDAADILGIPSVYRFIRDISPKTKNLSNAITVRGLLNVLYGLPANLNKLFTEELCNSILFDNWERLVELIKASTHTILISSISIDIFNELFGKNNIMLIQIPTHFREIGNNKYQSIDQPLPYVYKNIIEKIKKNVIQGTLVLVSAGIIGKIFIASAKSCGGIAIDIGSSIDTYITNYNRL